jgi:hypothetical protein
MNLALVFENLNASNTPAFTRLLDKQLLRAVFATSQGEPVFRWTALGKRLVENLDNVLPRVPREAEVVPEKPPGGDLPPSSDAGTS